MDINKEFISVKGEENLKDKNLSDAELGDEYVLEVTRKEGDLVGLTFKKVFKPLT